MDLPDRNGYVEFTNNSIVFTCRECMMAWDWHGKVQQERVKRLNELYYEKHGYYPYMEDDCKVINEN